MTVLGVCMMAAALMVFPDRPERLALVRRTSMSGAAGSRSRRALVVAAAVAAVWPVVLIGGLHLLCAAVLVGATVRVRRRAARRTRAHRVEVESLAAGLETIVGELRVGAHPAVACSTAAAECVGSVATAFGRASGRARLGGTAHEGLTLTTSPVRTELGVVAGAWRVADEHGLALVGLLSAARGDMLARNRFRDRTEASLAGARATGTVLACLPLVGVALGQAMGAAPIAVLLGGGFGGILLVIGTSLVCAGLLWTDSITGKVCR